MKILLIEDDEITAKYLLKSLKEIDHSIIHSNNGYDGLNHFVENKFDLIILDLMLPGIDGFQILNLIRAQNKTIPIIILSAKNDVDSKVKGLRGGSDDFLAKPFSFTELVARIDAISRRAEGTSSLEEFYLSNIKINLSNRRLFIDDKLLNLQPLEFKLITYLIKNKGRVVSKAMILENVWDFNLDPETNVVESRLSRLRTKLKEGGAKVDISAKRGYGYILDEI